jgi:hypothetical protein
MTTEQKIIRAKVGLLELAKQLGNVGSVGHVFESFGPRICRLDLGWH